MVTEKITSMSSMSKEAKKTVSRSEAERAVVRELVKGCPGPRGGPHRPDGPLKSTTATVLGSEMEEEMTEHLGRAKHQAPTVESGNICNGRWPKTVLTEGPEAHSSGR